MFEFLFGFLLGVWAGQSMPLPSVGVYVQSYFIPKVTAPPVEQPQVKEEEEMFTGEMPTHVPSV
jgi:hypothetical protein|tara:strand:+ start:288 stop:479 length:192 start_codon:yes stop_codon:yes gene_type:complete